MGLFSSITDSLGITGGSEGPARDALKLFQNIVPPSVKEQQVQFQQFQPSPDLSPEFFQDFVVGRSGFEDISEDPIGRQASINALNQLQEIVSAGGLDPEALAQLQEVTDTQRQVEQGQRGAILQGAQARGVGGSGLELASLLGASQGGANRAARQGQNIQAQAQQRVLDALLAGSDIGSRLRGQDFSQAAQRASAQDLINQFNARQQAQTQGQRFGAVQARQDLTNRNVDLENQRRLRNAGLIRQRFQDELQLAGRKADALNRVGQAKERRADRAGGFIDRAAGFVGGALGG